MNAFSIDIDDNGNPDFVLDRWVMCWLAHDVTGRFPPPWDLAGDDAAKARELLRKYFHSWAWDRSLGLSGASAGDMFEDELGTVLFRLQSLIGSLGPDVDEDLHQWLTTAG